MFTTPMDNLHGHNLVQILTALIVGLVLVAPQFTILLQEQVDEMNIIDWSLGYNSAALGLGLILLAGVLLQHFGALSGGRAGMSVFAAVIVFLLASATFCVSLRQKLQADDVVNGGTQQDYPALYIPAIGTFVCVMVFAGLYAVAGSGVFGGRTRATSAGSFW